MNQAKVKRIVAALFETAKAASNSHENNAEAMQNEANACLMKAKQLIAEYGLSEAEFTQQSEQTESIYHVLYDAPINLTGTWLSILTEAACLALPVRFARVQGKTASVYLFGTDSDCMIAKALLDILCDKAKLFFAELQKTDAKLIFAHYLLGFAHGCLLALRADAEKEQQTANEKSEAKQLNGTNDAQSLMVLRGLALRGQQLAMIDKVLTDAGIKKAANNGATAIPTNEGTEQGFHDGLHHKNNRTK
jgi:hypothetical protein